MPLQDFDVSHRAALAASGEDQLRSSRNAARYDVFSTYKVIPVTRSSDGSEARAWDLSSGPRKIAVGSIDRNATSQDESEFRDTIARIRELGG